MRPQGSICSFTQIMIGSYTSTTLKIMLVYSGSNRESQDSIQSRAGKEVKTPLLERDYQLRSGLSVAFQQWLAVGSRWLPGTEQLS